MNKTTKKKGKFAFCSQYKQKISRTHNERSFINVAKKENKKKIIHEYSPKKAEKEEISWWLTKWKKRKKRKKAIKSDYVLRKQIWRACFFWLPSISSPHFADMSKMTAAFHLSIFPLSFYSWCRSHTLMMVDYDGTEITSQGARGRKAAKCKRHRLEMNDNNTTSTRWKGIISYFNNV